VGDQCGEDNRADALGPDDAKQQREGWKQKSQHDDLTQLDAEIERKQRGHHVRSGQLQGLAQREREPEAVDQAEAECNRPSAAEAR
jgi:hypothetical protein